MKTLLNLSPNGELGLAKIRQVAMQNRLKTKKSELIELSIEIAVQAFEKIEENEFKKLTGLKK